MKNWGWVVLVVLLVGGGGLLWQYRQPVQTCLYSDAEKQTKTICVYQIKADTKISSPLKITGQAQGTWFFEASFPVKILDGNDQVLTQGIAQSHGEWMTADLIPFTAELKFIAPSTDQGTLVLQKDNPSGLPANDAALVVPIRFR